MSVVAKPTFRVKARDFRRLRTWAVRVAVATSLGWTVWTWSGGFSKLLHLLLGAAVVGGVLIALDALWLVGMAIQLVGAGKALRLGKTPAAWLRAVNRIRSTRTEAFENIANTQLVWLGFYVNAVAALGFAVLAPIVVITSLPQSTWLGVLAFLAADTLGTVFRIVPQKRAMDAWMGKLSFRTARPQDPKDLAGYLEAQRASWGEDMAADRAKLEDRFRVNPGGIFVAERRGRIVGVVTTIRIPHYDSTEGLSWDEITANGHCTTHSPTGKVMFGVDMSVTDDAPPGLHDDLLVQCTIQVMSEGLTAGVLGGRMPGYHKVADRMTAEEYLWSRRPDGKFLDPQVRMYASFPGLRVVGLLPDYFEDPDSQNNGVLLEWKNPIYGWPCRRLLARAAAMLIHLDTTISKWKKWRKSRRNKSRP